MTNASAAAGSSNTEEPSFTPVPVRPRHDGWTPPKQVAFIRALAETACVDQACRLVGLSQQSAYTLRSRPDAVSFRQAWAIAIDVGATKLADRAMARALDGTIVPIFYQGERVGERIVFNERLTQFLLRAHLPERFGAWRDKVMQVREHQDGAAMLLKEALRAVAEDAVADQLGKPRPNRALLPILATGSNEAQSSDGSYDTMVSHFRESSEAKDREIAALRRQLAERAQGDTGSTWPTSGTDDGAGSLADDR